MLLSSPTGSGKTLAGFLGIIDWLLRQPAAPEGICAIYVSPLRALTYDIQKNLAGPLRAMGLEERIRVGLRTGDTSAKDRAQFKRRPPQILLTTPGKPGHFVVPAALSSGAGRVPVRHRR